MKIEGEGQNFEGRESLIGRLIEELAQREEMNPNDIFSDIITFSELLEEDDGVNGYFDELAEKIGISFEEMVSYSRKLKER